MSSAGVGPLCFLKTNVTAPVYQEILEHFMLPSADQLFKDTDFIFQQEHFQENVQETSLRLFELCDMVHYPAGSSDQKMGTL